MEISQIRNVCLDILRGVSQRTISNNRGIARSSVQKFKQLLGEYGIDLFVLNGLEDQDLAKIIYGDNARIVPSGRKSERVIVGKDYKGRIDKSKFYKADFDTMVRRFSDNRNVTKKDLYIDYVQAAEAAGQPYMKRTSLVDARMPGKPLIITSQLKVTNYPAYLGGGAQAEAIVDRLVKPCKIITLEGESKREAPKE